MPHVLVVGTYRDDEVDDDLVGTFAAVAAATGERLDLAGLDAAACAVLLARHGVRPVDPAAGAGPDDLARRVAARTGGNPLFVREVARLVAAVGPAAASSTVPAGVRDVLRRRLAALGQPTALVLRHAAVLGRRSISTCSSRSSGACAATSTPSRSRTGCSAPASTPCAPGC